MSHVSRSDARDRQHYPLAETGFRRVIVWMLRAIFFPIMKLEVAGLEHLPAGGGAVLAANHVTNFDVFPIQFALPRTLFFMGKAEIFQNPVMDIVFRKLCAYPVYRGAHDEWAIRHSHRILAAGQMVAMFPEGTRSKGKGLRVGKTGAARLAIESRCPLVPVTVDGSHHFFKRFPRRNVVKITICPPIYPGLGEMPLELTERLMFTLAANLPPELRGVYGEAPAGFDAK